MLKVTDVFKCGKCGNIVEVVSVGGGTFTCCGESMNQLVENTTDAAREKHVPVIEKSETGITVKVGSVSHPMEEKHFIQWIEILTDGKVYRQQLQPGSKPEAFFPVQTSAAVTAREYCNLHGLWKA